MSKIRIKSIKVKNYRSFGEEQVFEFPGEDYEKPVSIVGYNNSGKTNLMNAILYSIGQSFVSKETFQLNDFHNKQIENIPEIVTEILSSRERKYDGKEANLNGVHKLNIQTDGYEIEGAKIDSTYFNGSQNFQAFGALKYYNVFFINFHNIKDEISTQKSSWGNLKSFLAKHIKKIVDSDDEMLSKKDDFIASTVSATQAVLEDSNLERFISDIKKNYSTNLRANNCEVEFGLPDYEDIFLQMMFKIGLNGDASNLVPLDHFGDGYISMFVMAVIQAIAESNTEDKCLFLFEEPESFLHENHQEYFYKMVLCKLAENGHQVIYTTHSDRMVDVFNTKGLIRLEFDEESKQTLKKYNNVEEFNPENPPGDAEEGLLTLEDYNQYIKTIEPNLNKILFSRKVILVEGPNDIMAYKYAIERKVESLYANIKTRDSDATDEEYSKEKEKFAQTYMNFNNVTIIPHHGKSTAFLLIDLCQHIGLDYYVINDWDLDEFFNLTSFQNFEQLHASEIYKNSPAKGMITTNWKLINRAGSEKIHFNVRKLETVLGYGSNDKDSVKIWNKLQEITNFNQDFFPGSLENFLEFNKLSETNLDNQNESDPPKKPESAKPKVKIAKDIDALYDREKPDGEIKLEDIPF